MKSYGLSRVHKVCDRWAGRQEDRWTDEHYKIYIFPVAPKLQAENLLRTALVVIRAIGKYGKVFDKH